MRDFTVPGFGIRPPFDGHPWHPRTLFSNGEAGAFCLPGPTTCYQDAAGTTPAGDGDPVGYLADLSGNGNHATQATSAARPTLAQDGAGNWYLDFDGVDDNFSAPLGAGFTGDFALILDTGPIFGSLDTGVDTTWGYTKNAAYIPDGKMNALIVIDRAFTAAEKQRIVGQFAGAVTSTPKTALSAWRDRTDLTAIDTGYGDWSGVTSARYAFFGCTGLTTPPGVSGWTGVTDARYAFRGCSGMTTPPDVSAWTGVTKAREAFLGCSGLTTPLDVSGWNPTILTDATLFMSDISAAGFDQTAYDAALIAWDAAYDLTTVNTLSIDFGAAKNTTGGAAETARNLLDANGWTITDGGPA